MSKCDHLSKVSGVCSNQPVVRFKTVHKHQIFTEYILKLNYY